MLKARQIEPAKLLEEEASPKWQDGTSVLPTNATDDFVKISGVESLEETKSEEDMIPEPDTYITQKIIALIENSENVLTLEDKGKVYTDLGDPDIYISVSEILK